MSSLLVFNRVYRLEIQISLVVIFDQPGKMLPLYLLSDFPTSPPLPKVNVQYIYTDSVWLWGWGGGGWGVIELCCTIVCRSLIHCF
jgi:hypothetical protein